MYTDIVLRRHSLRGLFVSRNQALCSLGPDWKCKFHTVLRLGRRDGVTYLREFGKVWVDFWENMGFQRFKRVWLGKSQSF